MKYLLKNVTQRLRFCGWLFTILFFVVGSNFVFGVENDIDAEKAIPKINRKTNDFDRLLENISPRQDCSVEVIDDQGVDNSARSANNNIALEKVTNEEREQCLISTEKAYQLWQSKKIQLVDVRPQKAYRIVHIPGSINIPEYAIKTKTFLQDKFIVLVNNGHTMDQQIRTCLKLKESGFGHVAVLQGGINGWGQNAPLQGDADVARIDRLSPIEFLQAQQENDWIIVDIAKEKRDLSSVFPGKTILKGNLKVKNYLTNPKNLPAGLLVVGANNGNSSEIPDILKKNKDLRVFYLNTSTDDYQEFLAKNRVMVAKLAAGPKRVKRCGG